MENVRLLCVSLGCNKSLVDTEKMLGLLNGLGLTSAGDETEADVILINICCFIGDTKEGSVNTVLEVARYGEEGWCKALIVAGCLAQRYKQEVPDKIPEADAILGTTPYEETAKVPEQVLRGEDNAHIACFHGLEELFDAKAKRVVTAGGCYIFSKISKGCDKRYTYYIIPYLRGPYHSMPIEELVEEASRLVRNGVEELVLVTQETALYGKDIYGKKFPPRLLHKLGKIPDIQWARIQYYYSEEITSELIEAIRTEERVCHYLDIPIQHANDRILERMDRKTSRAELTGQIGNLRRVVPDIALRTTLISGSPGETEDDHEELMDFVDGMEFKRLSVFTYSTEEDTPACPYPGQVPQELKEERRGELMELQQDIAFGHCGNTVRQVLTVLIKGKVMDEPVYMGRAYMDAPNVDGMVFVSTDTVSQSGRAGSGVGLMFGNLVRVKVTGAVEYDPIGEVHNESTQ